MKLNNLRVRPINGDEKFTKISDLSYRPSDLNNTYQRASLPHRSMFYGCTISDKIERAGKIINRVGGAFESLSWLKDTAKKGIQKIAYGKWVVIETLNLMAIVHNKDFYDANEYTNELVDGFMTKIRFSC